MTAISRREPGRPSALTMLQRPDFLLIMAAVFALDALTGLPSLARPFRAHETACPDKDMMSPTPGATPTSTTLGSGSQLDE